MAYRRKQYNVTGTGAWAQIVSTKTWAPKITFEYSAAATASTVAYIGNSASTNPATALTALVPGGAQSVENARFLANQGEQYDLSQWWANVPAGQILYVAIDEFYQP